MKGNHSHGAGFKVVAKNSGLQFYNKSDLQTLKNLMPEC